jgi:hypothetical protein
VSLTHPSPQRVVWLTREGVAPLIAAASTALKCKTNATAFVHAVEDSLLQLAKICSTAGTAHTSKAKL